SEYPLQGRAGTGVITIKLMPGDRVAAASIGRVDDLEVLLTARGKFKLVKFRTAPSNPRAGKGDYVISLGKTDRVCAITQIVQRPVAPPTLSHEPGSNGGSEYPE
ncbi:MAG TPA: DNA gyrase C-terminal beta-propeller domain-containing protein, partial [Aggregatilineales bacterium]|nr:DNA gyrase C-terminal beta-propeller domain-containing protein [Aggregatilineales bacterium]